MQPSPMRVLVVEDEVIIAMSLEDMLTDLGCTVVGPATNLDQALSLVQSEQFDVALLDVNLNGHHSRPVAEMLVSRSIPYALITGYGSAALDLGNHSIPLLSKPCRVASLQALLEQVAAR